MSLSSGTRLGPYEVGDLLGAGGMGEVYKAHDTRLGRTVAIKVLARDIAADETVRTRFAREAQAVAALDHPHICGIYDVGESEGVNFFVMPWLDGQTLAARLTQGALPIDQALTIAAQIADALDRAHRHGIIHRDLKPANVMLTKAGAKLLDFGIAKLKESHGTIAMTGHTRLPTADTAQGTLLGTMPYMAPEQIEGREVDARCDIWAFGAVLYEMITGRQAFQGDTPASVIGAVLKDHPPPVSQRQPLASAALDHLVNECLAKDPDQRWQSAADLRRQLLWIARTPASTAGAVTRPRANRGAMVAALIALALLIALAVDGARTRWFAAAPGAEPYLFTIDPPAGHTFVGPPASVATPQLALSPDGRYLAFVAGGADGRGDLWIRTLADGTTRRLPETEDAADFFWAPDSRAIAYYSRSTLKRLDLFSSNPPEILARATVDPRGGAWSPTVGVLFAARSAGNSMMHLPAPGGTATPLDLPEVTSHRWPEFLPDGRQFLFSVRTASAEKRGVYVGSIGSTAVRHLLQTDWNARYASRHVLFLSGSTLMAQPFVPERIELTGRPVAIARGVGASSTGYGAFTVSSNGVLAFAPGLVTPSELRWIDRGGKTLGTAQGAGDYIDFRLSPDGSKLAFSRADAEVQSSDIWVLDLDRSTVSRLTTDPMTDAAPLWSPTGDALIFRSNRTGPSLELFRTTPNPGGPVESIYGGAHITATQRSIVNVLSTDWSPDGAFVVFHSPSFAASYDLSVIAVDPPRKVISVAASSANEIQGAVSPDGKWIAYASDESGRYEIYVQEFPAGTRKTIVSTQGGTQPRWRNDGRELFYLQSDGTLMVAAIRAAAHFDPAAPVALFKTTIPTIINPYRMDYVPANDGQRFLMKVPVNAAPLRMTVILNWPALLRQNRAQE